MYKNTKKNIKCSFLSIKSLCCGASGENRTLVPSLENLYTNRCTTLAYLYSPETRRNYGVGNRN